MTIRTYAAGLTLPILIALTAGPAAELLTPISGALLNPVAGGDESDPAAVTACNGAPQPGTVYRNSETEPHLAVNPADPDSMIAGWHQDRWSTGGAQSLRADDTFDGGASWTQVILPFTRCAGGNRLAGVYERASGPWISFMPDGTAIHLALSFDISVSENALLSGRSLDGGASWQDFAAIARSPAQDGPSLTIFNDKNTLAANPVNSGHVYANRTLFQTDVTSLYFARSTHGGVSWGAPRPIDHFGNDTRTEQILFRQGSQIVVVPDGTLVNLFYRIFFDVDLGDGL